MHPGPVQVTVGVDRGAGNSMHVLALNTGSSSLKFGLYRVAGDRASALLDGEIERTGHDDSRIRAVDGAGQVVLDAAFRPGPGDLLARIARVLDEASTPPPDAVGHRIVHGGFDVRRHGVIDARMRQQLGDACSFAPLHLPPALALIDSARRRYPDLPQVACLDTAFHATLDDVARILPLPRAYAADGIQRYGFHGLSCESIVRSFERELPPRMVIAHLGNGASVTAVRDGRSIDTTMGLTPAGGIVMGTRSGDLDPGVLIHLMRSRQLDADGLEDLVNHRSGMAGLSGLDGDMRRLRAEPTNDDARLAVDMFCYAARKQIAAMVAALGGAEAVVFSGGIGENDARSRAGICEGLGCLDLHLDAAANDRGGPVISGNRSGIAVRVVASKEDEQIAWVTGQVLGAP